MMLERGTSRSGQPILLWRGKPLHSTYDPVSEARRFARTVVEGLPASPVIVIVGAALGYLEAAVSAELPGARLLRVMLDPAIAGLESEPPAAPGWHPGLGGSLGAFLGKSLDESDVAGLRVIEWAPCAAAWPEQAALARREIRDFVQSLRASYATTASFGPLWLRNTLANFVGLTRIGRFAEPRGAVCIAASGPSLAEAVPAIARCRDRMELWALPSAVRALLAAGLRPDLVVLTDAGLYALQHLSELCALPVPMPVAMPLAAARGSWRLSGSVLLFAQPFLFEKELAALLAPWPLPVIPPQGTVAASALQLAVAVGHRIIVFAGLDFCFRDVLSHARPSLFEIYHSVRSGRMTPFDGALFAQAADAQGDRRARTTPALEAYARWFAAAALPAGVKAVRLAPSRVPLPSLAPLEPRELPDLLPAPAAAAHPPSPVAPPPGRAAVAAAAVGRWMRELDEVRGESPSRWPPLPRELCFFLDLPGYAQARSRGGAADEAVASALSRLASLRSRLEPASIRGEDAGER